jgi:flagellar basal body-associated protein FliL
MNNPEAENNQPPYVAEEEMKMPENSDMADTPESTEAEPKTSGVLLAVLLVVLLAILGGLYYWFTLLEMTAAPAPVAPAVERPTPEENDEPESTTAEAQTETLEVVSTSNEIDAIEADIEATNLDDLDAELNAIDAELEAALEDL